MSRQPENFLDYIFVLNIFLLSSAMSALSIYAGRMFSPWLVYEHIYYALEYIVAKFRLNEPFSRIA